MRRHFAPALAVILIILIAASLIWLRDYTPFGGSTNHIPTPTFGLRLDDSELIGWSGGKPAWKFYADSVEVSRDRVYTTFTGIRSGAIYDRGKPILKLSGRRLTYNTFTHNIDASGHITAKAADKLTITTERLTWNSREQKLDCPKRVTIATAAGKGYATSLTADFRNTQVELNQASMRIPVEEELLERKL